MAGDISGSNWTTSWFEVNEQTRIRFRFPWSNIAVGRKNWMFAGSALGGETAATLFTITSSCHRHGVDAFAYLRDILERLAYEPNPPPEQLRDWLPDRWKPPPAPAATPSTAESGP